MAHYLVLYHDEVVSSDDPDFSTWTREVGNALVDSGGSLTDGKRTKAGQSQPIEDLPCTNYVILETSTQDEAVELAGSFPGLDDQNSIDIYRLSD